MSIAGALTVDEFKQRNNALNVQLCTLESQLEAIRQEEEKSGEGNLNIAEIRRVLDRELSFEGEIDTALVASILDKIVVKKESTKEEIHLDIYLKLGQQYEAVYATKKSSASINCLRNTTPKRRTKRT